MRSMICMPGRHVGGLQRHVGDALDLHARRDLDEQRRLPGVGRNPWATVAEERRELRLQAVEEHVAAQIGHRVYPFFGARACASSTIFTLALAPMRVAPAAIILIASSNVRMPPEAFTPSFFGATVRRHQRDVLGRGAAAGEPGRGLDEVGAGLHGQLAGADLLVVGQQRRLQDHLAERPAVPAGLDHRADVAAAPAPSSCS